MPRSKASCRIVFRMQDLGPKVSELGGLGARRQVRNRLEPPARPAGSAGMTPGTHRSRSGSRGAERGAHEGRRAGPVEPPRPERGRHPVRARGDKPAEHRDPALGEQRLEFRARARRLGLPAGRDSPGQCPRRRSPGSVARRRCSPAARRTAAPRRAAPSRVALCRPPLHRAPPGLRGGRPVTRARRRSIAPRASASSPRTMSRPVPSSSSVATA